VARFVGVREHGPVMRIENLSETNPAHALPSGETAYRVDLRRRDDVIRVAVVDDHPIMRDGLVYTFDRETDFEVVGQGASGTEAIQIAELLLPDLIFLDINMPGDGLDAARNISTRCPAVRIIMLTAHDGEQQVVDALRGGASGYVVKGISSEELVKTARAVHGGEAYVSPALAARLLGMRGRQASAARPAQSFVDLTAREEQILRLVCEGQSNKEIGEQIGLTEKTVKHYMTNILQKLHARNRVEAALIARQRLGE
jgi:two-component system nitrate/nitrite response regulator NarL